MAPSTTKQWTVDGNTGFDALNFNENAPVPEVGDKDVLVKIHAASLNYRDLIIPKGKYPFPMKDNIVPGSDGAGTVEKVGKQVTRFKPGDKVVTLFNQGHIAGSLNAQTIQTGLGGVIDGTLREYGVFDEAGLITMPQNLNFLEASTLSCAALTAWNALYGLESRALKPGQTVLTQGTGGVSIFALQFAKAAGARVIATTSSEKKAEILKKLGADHVINYKEDQNWGETAAKITGTGVDHVVEVGGPKTMAQSIKAAAIDGVISIIGFIGGTEKDQPTFLDCLSNICTVRGLLVGSRLQMEDMCAAIEANNLHPVVDEKVFELKDLKEAYQYMWDQKHFGKLTIKVAS
ncbi:NAD(P)-binding protein [Cucurbitaria berberidis CBS 394.84]|uniref:NAD(P)-binding protein n=1 Tax=Cucurbitaria berberidis CBS 394.84 TaxID=1168544 RepID=A0A9P4GJX5_9PLEO|nr:NAD(P)-binding protein [Cucurbitaria berberidis CBS 394.84]KAF1846751.1 NAD(P)-binding protein [Cucurbitaria berberidis CBS 394.84]